MSAGIVRPQESKTIHGTPPIRVQKPQQEGTKKSAKEFCQQFANKYTVMVRQIVKMHVKVFSIIWHPREKSTVIYWFIISAAKQFAFYFALFCIHDNVDSSYLGEQMACAVTRKTISFTYSQLPTTKSLMFNFLTSKATHGRSRWNFWRHRRHIEWIYNMAATPLISWDSPFHG